MLYYFECDLIKSMEFNFEKPSSPPEKEGEKEEIREESGDFELEKEPWKTGSEYEASAPLMITKDMRQSLIDRGMSREEIRELTPQEAHRILNREAKKQKERPEPIPARSIEEIKPKGEQRDFNSEKKKEKPGVRFEFNLLPESEKSWIRRIAKKTGEKVDTVTEQISSKIERFHSGIEKGLEKFRKKQQKESEGDEEKPLSRGEKRAERLKEWEEMSEEERKEKYRRWNEEEQKYEYNRHERAERLYTFERTRINFMELEEELNKRSTLIGRTLEKFNLSKAEQSLEELEKDHVAALTEYKHRRAEVVESNVWLALNEKMRIAEQKAMRHQEGVFEKMREKWRWLGEQNVEKFLSSVKGIKPESKIAKTLARTASLRTVAGLGLLGGGMAVGFGSAAGITALAARRVMGGTSAAFGSYDLMSQAREKQALAVDIESVAKMKTLEIEEKLAEFEARAKLSGERLVRSEEYQELRRVYAAHTIPMDHLEKMVQERDEETMKKYGVWEDQSPQKLRYFTQELGRRQEADNGEDADGVNVQEALRYLDTQLQEKGEVVLKEEKHRKFLAGVTGIASIATFNASSIAEMLHGSEYADIPLEQIQEAAQQEPVLSADTLQEATETEALLPEDTLTQAESVNTELTSPPELAPPSIEAAQEVESIVGTVKEGGSAWQAAYDLVENNNITKQQFREAWSSATSMVELESGKTIHISELGLTHAGDQVVYVPETEDMPAHFEVVDYTKDGLHVGSNEDLAAAFDTAGQEHPRWLQDALGAESVEVPDPEIEIASEDYLMEQVGLSKEEVSNLDLSNPESIFEQVEIPAEPSQQEALEAATAGNLEVAESIKLNWGTAEFIQNEETGDIISINLQESSEFLERPAKVQETAIEFLNPKYVSLPQPREQAWKLQKLMDVFRSLPNQDGAEGVFIRKHIKEILERNVRKLRPGTISSISRAIQ